MNQAQRNLYGFELTEGQSAQGQYEQLELPILGNHMVKYKRGDTAYLRFYDKHLEYLENSQVEVNESEDQELADWVKQNWHCSFSRPLADITGVDRLFNNRQGYYQVEIRFLAGDVMQFTFPKGEFRAANRFKALVISKTDWGQ